MTWRYPVDEPVVVTSPFAPLRRNPATGAVEPHTGTDFRARPGARLYAAHGGTVVRATFTDRTGNYVRIDVGGGVWIGYSHLSVIAVSPGERVGDGELIGLAGSTGYATAAHLHFEVCVGGTKVDPVPFLEARTIAPPPVVPPTPAPRKDRPMLLALDDLGRGRLLYGDSSWSFITEAGTYAQLKAAGIPEAGRLTKKGTAEVFAGVKRGA